MTPRARIPLHLLFVVACASGAQAQVSSSEPFGGRPFGAPPGTPSLQQQRQEQLQQQQQATMGAAAPTVVQVVPPPAPAPAPVPQAAAPVPPPAPTTVGPGAAMQASRTTGQVPGGAPPPVQAMPPAPPSQPVNPPAAAPAPATMSPPFAARNAPAASAPAASAQQPVKGLPGDAPKLVITGSVFSPNPSQRYLIVNGQPFREGADLGQGVVLEQVHKESAVLGFKGSKYNVMF